MASLSQFKSRSMDICDPGIGLGVLSCALVEKLILHSNEVENINLVGYETDEEIIPYTEQALSYLQSWVKANGKVLIYTIIKTDFVTTNSTVLRIQNHGYFEQESTFFPKFYDIIISNPPYFKLSRDDEKAIAAKELVSGQPNIYALFLGISSKLLKRYGELIFITPRSFASGNYFKSFRLEFFKNVVITNIHLFNSRKDAFNRDSVLQETLILRAVKQSKAEDIVVKISSSNGVEDIANSDSKSYLLKELIDFNSTEKILHIPSNKREEIVFSLVNSWHNTIRDFDIHVSTGPVVSFRAIKFIQDQPSKDVQSVSLFWLQNICKMKIEWPKMIKGKGQFIEFCPESMSILVPAKDYIILRRFSSKDDKSRLIAAPFFSDDQEYKLIGLENKLNYIYRKNGCMKKTEVIGLCALLNSDLYNIYFQSFNGNVNVSATEIREMKLPPYELILKIGERLIESNNYSMDNVNLLIKNILHINL